MAAPRKRATRRRDTARPARPRAAAQASAARTAATAREAPLALSPERFRALGRALVDRIAEHLTTLRDQPVTRGESPRAVRAALDAGAPAPQRGMEPARLLDEATRLLFEHSLFNGHPRFYGYITSPAAPIGTLGDLLAAAVNANCGSFSLAPIGTEIERQTVRWIAELIGFPPGGDGLLVSGGNMANFVCFLAARRARAPWDLRAGGLGPGGQRLRVYASSEAHTWLEKACDLFGHGTDALHRVAVDAKLRMEAGALERAVEEDRARGELPFLVVGTGGTVATGAVDPLARIAEVCRAHGLWFHVDGAYGGLAAMLPDAPAELRALAGADSIAVDPHKWLYAPLEAGCALVRDPEALVETFRYRPPYYHFDEVGGEQPVNFYERGPQNSRGLRALKVWLGLRQAGRDGYVQMIRDDIRLAERLFERAGAHPRLQAFTHGLSIATFRFVPAGLTPGEPADEEYLNRLNAELLERLQAGGRAYLSNAVIGGAFVLRACIVNFRTTAADVDALPPLVAEIGAALDRELRGSAAVR